MAGEIALRTRHPGLRASDEERERAVEELRRHYAAGRLTAVELEERVAHAYRARTRGDLVRAFEALPRRRRPLRVKVARAKARAALADDDLAAAHGLAGEHLHAQALGLRVAPVAAGAQSLLMRHRRPPPSSSARAGARASSPR